MKIDIVCNRDDFLVCVKQPGMISESEGLPALLCAQENIRALYPVHRLDLGTGGLTVLAKTPEAASLLSKMFSDGSVNKEYLAVVQSDELSPSGEFRDFLYHDKKTNKTYVVRRMRKGVKEAACSWKTLETVSIHQQPFHLVRVYLHTGRTHQIRVQFASRKAPLFGDTRYGSKEKAPYPALWAAGLSFPDPKDPASVFTFCSAPPAAEPWNAFLFFTAADAGDSGVLPPQSV